MGRWMGRCFEVAFIRNGDLRPLGGAQSELAVGCLRIERGETRHLHPSTPSRPVGGVRVVQQSPPSVAARVLMCLQSGHSHTSGSRPKRGIWNGTDGSARTTSQRWSCPSHRMEPFPGYSAIHLPLGLFRLRTPGPDGIWLAPFLTPPEPR